MIWRPEDLRAIRYWRDEKRNEQTKCKGDIHARKHESITLLMVCIFIFYYVLCEHH